MPSPSAPAPPAPLPSLISSPSFAPPSPSQPRSQGSTSPAERPYTLGAPVALTARAQDTLLDAPAASRAPPVSPFTFFAAPPPSLASICPLDNRVMPAELRQGAARSIRGGETSAPRRSGRRKGVGGAGGAGGRSGARRGKGVIISARASVDEATEERGRRSSSVGRSVESYSSGSPDRPAKRHRFSLDALPSHPSSQPALPTFAHCRSSPASAKPPLTPSKRIGEGGERTQLAHDTAREVRIYDGTSESDDENWAEQVTRSQPLSDAETSGENLLRRNPPTSPLARSALQPVRATSTPCTRPQSRRATQRMSMSPSALSMHRPPPGGRPPSSPDVADLSFDLSALDFDAGPSHLSAGCALDGTYTAESGVEEKGEASRFAEGAAGFFVGSEGDGGAAEKVLWEW